MILPNSMVFAPILCQMLQQYVMADVEPMLWQMLLPLFNSVVDVGTTCWLTIKSSVKTFVAGVIATVADGKTTCYILIG